jgi:hypothetical protein
VRYVDWLGKPVVDVQRCITPFLFDDNRAREMDRWRHTAGGRPKTTPIQAKTLEPA